MGMPDDWESSIEAVWHTFDDLSDEELRTAIDRLAR